MRPWLPVSLLSRGTQLHLRGIGTLEKLNLACRRPCWRPLRRAQQLSAARGPRCTRTPFSCQGLHCRSGRCRDPRPHPNEVLQKAPPKSGRGLRRSGSAGSRCRPRNHPSEMPKKGRLRRCPGSAGICAGSLVPTPRRCLAPPTRRHEGRAFAQKGAAVPSFVPKPLISTGRGSQTAAGL